MTRQEIWREVMKRWPAHRLQDVKRMTPREIFELLDCKDNALTFSNQAEYERWLAKTM